MNKITLKNKILQLKGRCKPDRLIYIYNDIAEWSPCNASFELSDVDDKFFKEWALSNFYIGEVKHRKEAISIGFSWDTTNKCKGVK